MSEIWKETEEFMQVSHVEEDMRRNSLRMFQNLGVPDELVERLEGVVESKMTEMMGRVALMYQDFLTQEELNGLIGLHETLLLQKMHERKIAVEEAAVALGAEIFGIEITRILEEFVQGPPDGKIDDDEVTEESPIEEGVGNEP